MAYNDDQNEYPLPAGNNKKRTSVEQLPRFFRTPQNKKFLSSTLDQLTNPGVIEKINGFVGKREAKAVSVLDNYLDDVTKERQDYQFEPVSVYEDFLGSTKYYADYNDYMGLLKTYNANTNNHSALNEQEYYAWNPNINLDKFVNFREYYWLPNGPQEVAVTGQSNQVVSTYKVEVLEQDNDISLVFYPDGLTKNPNLNLYRGQTYRFEINSPNNPLTIALYRGVDPNERLDDSSILNQTYTEGVTLIPDTDDTLLNQQDFVADDYIEKGVLEFTIPENAPDTLYFVSQYDLNISTRLIIADISENSSIDVENEIIGKKTYTTSDGWKFSNGMKVYFTGNVVPEKYASGIYYVDGVGDEIKLISTEDLQVPAIFTNDSKIPFDANGFDRVPFSDAKSFAGTKDYIVVNKASADRNPWARYNRWFHKDVITKSAELNNQPAVLDESQRAKRPIIEFDKGLKLFNFGSKAKTNIDLIDTYTNDVKSKIEGQSGYSIDGVELAEGMRVMFTADADSFVYGKIFQVKFFEFKGNSQISLVETDDTIPYENETVLITSGNNNAGNMYWYDGSQWKLGQTKTGINQAPKFDLCDEDGNSFSDDIIYPNTDFTGNRVFDYRLGEGINDTELGFPLTYKNINNTGDILFNFSLLSEDFTYEVLNTVITKKTSTGFLKKYDIDGNNFEYINGWIKAPMLSKQYVIRKYTGEERTNSFKVDVFDQSALLDDLKVVVYVNNLLKSNGVDYSLAADSNNNRIINFENDLNVDDVLVIKAHSKASKNSKGYYETAHNFERNPLNDDITEFTLGEVTDHLDSAVIEIESFQGNQPGSSNLRDLGDIKPFGRKFVQHSGPINLPLFCISNKENNLVASLNFAKNEYSKFKRAFIQEAENIDISGSVKEQVDQVLLSLAKDKKSTMPFYKSDMLGIGASKKIEHIVLDPDLKFYALSTVFTLTTLSEKAVSVYVNDTQACHGLDYTFTNEGFIQFVDTFNLQEDDRIDIFEYETTNGSYIPQTPTKLGLYPAYKPEIFIDTTYETNQTVIRGHDGSIVIAYEDYRDELLLELEKRFYNNIKVSYDTSVFDIYDYISGEYRNSKVSKQDLNRILIGDFVKWASKAGNPDYTDNSFVKETQTFTYNYGFGSSKNNKPLSGFWRGIYMDAYDTDSPNLRPWEMLGFSVKPSWWESKYGPAPYTKDNLVLWNDLEKGIIRSSDTLRTDKRFIRPGLTKHIPVDSSGNVVSPLNSGYVNEFSFAIQNGKSFKFGDHTPAETAWRRSSEYPFALLKAIMLNRPAQVVGVAFDKSRIKRNINGQIVYQGDESRRLKLSNLKFVNSDTRNNVLTGGLVNYIYDYMSSDVTTQYENFTTKLTNLKQKIAFKLGGFADKEKLKLVLDSKNPSNKGNVFVPFENYKIDLIESSPLQTITYSGVIIEKQTNGFKISGYDRENPVFTYSTPIVSNNDISINVGGISESFLFWSENKQYVAGKIVRYQNNYYRVNINHTTADVFDTSFYTPLKELPVIGGATGTLRKNFSNVTATLDYGTVLSTKQEVVDFIQGYDHYLKSQGFVFDYFNRETEAVENWVLSVKEFLFYTTQNWAVGTIIALSPAANSLNFFKEYYVIDNVKENIFNYKILNLDGTAIKDINISINRDSGNAVEILPATAEDGIYFCKLGLVQKDHSVILDNTTVFNDTIYSPSSGYRQERIKVVGYRTDEWNGNLNIPGFIYDQADVTEWEQWKDYALGDLVKYKEFYYSANTFVSGSADFEINNWNRLDEKPESGLKTNFDYKANQFADFYDLDTDNFDSEQQRLAQHLIGYQKREYLNNIIEDDISQYKFYQGFIQEKGTLNSLTKLFDKLGSADKESLEFYEEWAIRNAQYGATDVFDELEYKLDETKFRIEPQIIEFVNTVNNNRTDLVYEIPESKVYIKPENYSTTPFPQKWSTEEYTKTAGYVSLDQVDFIAKTPTDILALDINNVRIDDIIWVTSEKNSWNVYQHILVPNRVLTFTKTDTGFDLQFDSIPEIEAGEIFGLKFVDDGIDGFYKAATVSSTVVSVTADVTSEDFYDLSDSTNGAITKLLSKRYDTPDGVNNDLNTYGLNKNNKIWIDNVSDNKFGVFENNQIFDGKDEIINREAGDSDFGSSFAVNDVNSIFAVGKPEDQKIYIYTRSSESLRLNFIQEIEMPVGYHDNASGFGQKIKFSYDGQFMFVAAPLASNVKTKYKGEAESAFPILAGDIVSDRGTLWQAKVDTEDDSSSINVNSQDWKQVYKIPADVDGSSSGLSNQGVVYVYKKQLDNSYYLLEQFVSNEPTANEKFGIGLETAFTTDEIYKLYVRSEGNNGRVYIYDTTYLNLSFEATVDPLFRGSHDNFHSYVKNEIVQFQNSLFRALVDIPSGGNDPTDITLWIEIEANIDRFGFLPYSNTIEGDNDSTAFNNTNQAGKNIDVSSNGEVLTFTAYNTVTEEFQVNVYRIEDGRYAFYEVITAPQTDILWGESLAISDDGKYIAVGANSADVSSDRNTGIDKGLVYIYKYNDTSLSFVNTQTLQAPNSTKNERFGYKLDFSDDKLCVIGINGLNVGSTLFDNDETIFDNRSTQLFDFSTKRPQAYTYELLNDIYTVSEVLDYESYYEDPVTLQKLERDLSLADDVELVYQKNHLYLGFKGLDTGDNKTGLIFDLRADRDVTNWNTLGAATDFLDYEKMRGAFLYDNVTSDLITYIDFIDPIQGKIANAAERELKYKLYYDPAVYNIGSTSTGLVNPWGSESVGDLLWDLSAVKWYNPYQKNSEYSANTWNKIIPGYSVDIYEWVESDLLPEEWDEIADTTEGLAQGISGLSRYGNTRYVRKNVYDPISGLFSAKYYYWVKNSKVLPAIETRNLSASAVSSLIEDPAGNGYRFLAMFGSDNFAIYNCRSLIKDQDTILHFEYYKTEEVKINNLHREYNLLTEGLATSQPNDRLVNKWIDSLVGYDEQKTLLPVTTLSPARRYGILDQPLQTMFVNRTEALKQVVERINLVLAKNLIVDEYDISKLSSKDPVPNTVSREYDTIVENETLLRFVGTSKIKQAVLDVEITDGRLTNVEITEPGRGYIDPAFDSTKDTKRRGPKVTIQGTGTGAEIETFINNLGQVIEANIVNAGKNYSNTTVITVRPFTALIQTDTTLLGFWATYIWNTTEKEWIRVNNQGYDASLYWQYIDWYAQGYSSETAIDYLVPGSYALGGLEDNLGDIVKIESIGTGGWLLLRKIDNQLEVDYTVNYETIGRQNGTLEFSRLLYSNEKFGFDKAVYDSALYDRDAGEEVRIILNAIQDDIFVDELAVEWNKLFFSSVRYALSEQPNIDWIFKTAFIKAKHNVGALEQKTTYKSDSLESYNEYVNEVKPYSTKLREFVSAYENIDPTQTVVSDFDLPPRYDVNAAKIISENPQVIDSEIRNYSSFVTTYPQRNWFDNVGFEITDIKIISGGSGWTSSPKVTISGGGGPTITGRTTLSGDKITGIVVDTSKAKYITTPDITFSGDQSDGTDARAIAYLGKSPVRSTHMLIKFDRITGSYFVTDLDVTENFVGTGSKIEFVLKWPMNLTPSKTKILVNGVEQLSNAYSVENVLDDTVDYTRYYGKIVFTVAPENNAVIVVEYDKDVNYLSAADRINFFYNPETGQFGKELAQLMDGVDYGGVQIDTAFFGGKTGFDNGDLFGSTEFDVFNGNAEDEIFLLDGSTKTITVSEPFESGVEYNIYYKSATAGLNDNPIRIDDPDYGEPSLQNDDAIMVTIVGDGITSTFEIDEDQLVTKDGDTIIVRKATSDGSVTPSGVVFDTQLTGGDLTNIAGKFSTATGIDSGDIVIDGDDFVSAASNRGPEENVPGQILDTVDIQVFERVNKGQGAITVQNFRTDGISAEYPVENLPATQDSVIVKLDNVVLDPSQYEIDYVEKVLRISDSSLLPVGKHLSLLTIGTNGSNIIESDTFTGDGRTDTFITYYKFEQNITAVVAIDGVVTTNFALDKSGPEYGDNANKVMIMLGDPPAQNSIITYTLYNGSGQQYSQLAIDDTFDTTVSTNRSHTFGVDGAVALPFNKKPYSHNILVKQGDRFLDAGHSIKHTMTSERVYAVDNWQFEDQTSIRQNDVLVYINDKKIEPVNYVYSTIDARLELTTRAVGKPGDILKIYFINDAEYFFVDTEVKLSNAGTLVDYQPLDQINFELGDSTGVIATVQEYNKVNNDVTIKLQGYVRDLFILADKDDQPTLYFDDSTNFKIDSVKVVESDRLSLKEIPNEDVKIYVFSNHDTNEFERLSLRVRYSDANAPVGSDNYIAKNLLSRGEIQLNTKIPGPEYAWVFVNGKFLTSQSDYILSDNREIIILSEQPNENDLIEVLYFTADVSNKKFAFRIFKDLLNRYHYKRINSNREYELAADLNWFDLSIVLKDSEGLDEPNKELAIPGIIFVNGERIEYFVKQGNVLRQLRRGTLGTGIKEVHAKNSRVFHQGVSETIPYQDTTYTQNFTSTSYKTEIAADGSTTYNVSGANLLDYKNVKVYVNDILETNVTVNSSSITFTNNIPISPSKILITAEGLFKFTLNWTPSGVNEFDVFVAGTRLRKATPVDPNNITADYNYYQYNGDLDQDSPGGDVIIPAEFTVENNILVLENGTIDTTEIKIVRKTGKVWNDDGVSLTNSKNTIAKFLTDSTYKLAR